MSGWVKPTPLVPGHSHRAIPWGLIPDCCGPVSDFILNDPSGKSICKLVVFDISGSQFVTIAGI